MQHVLHLPSDVVYASDTQFIVWDRLNKLYSFDVDARIAFDIDAYRMLPLLKRHRYNTVFNSEFICEIDSKGVASFRFAEEYSDAAPLGSGSGETNERTEQESTLCKKWGCITGLIIAALILLFVVCTPGGGYDCAREGNRTFGDDAGVADVLAFMERCEY